MKRFTAMMALLFVSVLVNAEDNKVSPAPESAPVASQSVVAEPAPTPTTSKDMSQAPSETPAPKAESVKPAEPVASEAVVPVTTDAPAALPASMATEKAPTVTAEPVKTSADEPKTVAASKSEGTDHVPQIKPVMDFHDKEMAVWVEMKTRWNGAFETALKKRQDLETSLAAKNAKIAVLSSHKTKSTKAEARTLKKEVSTLTKDIKSANQDIQAQLGKFVDEVESRGKSAEQALKQVHQQAIKDIKTAEW